MATLTINAGSSVLIRLTIKDVEGDVIPTEDIANLTASLVSRACGCDGAEAEEEVLGTWTFESPDEYSAGIATGGDGIFIIEVLTTQTLTPGLYSLVTQYGVFDSDYFESGAQQITNVTEDVLEILAVPSFGTSTPEGDDFDGFVLDDNGDGVADDNGDLLVA